MKTRILVAYATRQGSTAGVAAAVGEALSNDDCEVDVLPLDEVGDISVYSAVVIGAPMRLFRWVGEARRFVSDNREALERIPVACFAVCIGLAKKRALFDSVSGIWERAVKKKITPVDTALFAGALDRSKLPLVISLGTRLIGAPDGDFRDWSAIREWAESLPDSLIGL